MEQKQWWMQPGTICIVVGLLGALIYLPTLQFGYVNLDDPWLIKNNTLLQQANLSTLHSVWFDLSTAQRLRLGGEYLPVRDMSVMLDFLMFSDWVGGFHLTNVLLYGLLCAGFAGLILSWIQSPALAWLAGTLFAAHPVHVEAVAWLSERKGLLAGAFLMMALLLFRRFAQHRSWLSLVGSHLLLCLAIWSKALAITGLGILAALLWFFPSEKGDSPSPTATFFGWLSFCIVGVAAFAPVWLTGQRVNMVQSFHGGSWWETLKLMTTVHGHYWKQLVYVSEFGIKYPLQPGQGFTGLTLLGALSFFGLLAFLVFGFLRKSWRVAGFAAACWFIFLAPVSQLIFPLQNFVADRYMLLPSVAFALLAGEGMRRSLQKIPRLILWGFLLLLSTGLCVAQSATWKNTKSMYLQALRVHPTWVAGMMQLAHIDGKKGHYKKAQQWVERARKINPNHPKIAIRSSILLLRQGKSKRAINVLIHAAKFSKDDKLRANLALLLMRQGRIKEALKWAREAASIRSLLVHNQRVLGVVALRAKKLVLAREAFEKALSLQPGHPQNYRNMAAVLMHLGQKAKAQSMLNKGRLIMRQRRRR